MEKDRGNVSEKKGIALYHNIWVDKGEGVEDGIEKISEIYKRAKELKEAKEGGRLLLYFDVTGCGREKAEAIRAGVCRGLYDRGYGEIIIDAENSISLADMFRGKQ